jgi:hypothetical protein
MVRRSMVCALAAASAATILSLACSSPPPGNRLAGELPALDGQDPGPSDPSTPTPKTSTPADDGTCNLQRSGLVFATAACNTCMQTSCCAQTLACVKGDPKCAELQQCLLACPVPDGTRDAGPDGAREGGGGGGTGGGTGAGAQKCRDDCFAKYTATTKATQKAYNDCVLGPCGASCK